MNEPMSMAADSTEQAMMFEKAVAFIQRIGITVHFGTLEDSCFLPGIHIADGEIVVDMDKLKYPGDILHEAGHIAVVPAAERRTLNPETIKEREHRAAEEMMAIAWSFAACVHLDIDAHFVFHAGGYKDGGNSIVKNFEQGHFFAVPMLQWVGMTLEKKNDAEPGMPVYPAMLKWLRI